jgi:hypothetical protein
MYLQIAHQLETAPAFPDVKDTVVVLIFPDQVEIKDIDDDARIELV